MNKFKKSIIYKEYQDIKQRKKYLKFALKRYSRNGIILGILFLLIYIIKYQKSKIIINLFNFLLSIGVFIKNLIITLYDKVQVLLLNRGIFTGITCLLVLLFCLRYIQIRRNLRRKESDKIQDYVNYNLEESMLFSIKYVVMVITTVGLIILSDLMLFIDNSESIFILLIIFIRIWILYRVLILGLLVVKYQHFIKSRKSPKNKVDMKS